MWIRHRIYDWGYLIVEIEKINFIITKEKIFLFILWAFCGCIKHKRLSRKFLKRRRKIFVVGLEEFNLNENDCGKVCDCEWNKWKFWKVFLKTEFIYFFGVYDEIF